MPDLLWRHYGGGACGAAMNSAPSPAAALQVLDTPEIVRRAAVAGLGARLNVAEAVRDIVHRLARSEAGDAELAAVAQLLREAGAVLEGQPEREGYVRSVEGALTGLGTLSELGPFTGRLHPTSPQMDLLLGTDRAEARATYGSVHQGAPGFVHGGYIAATFDEMLGVVQRDTVRMTVELKLSYRAPVPLHEEVRYTSWLDRVEGRKAFVVGTLHHGDRLCAEATAVFVAPAKALF
ncbi:PaaI family thioesterase [Rhizorhabdus argentea]|uniref:PaaI family thioesterase n=1 Tax=Rhizorhabdus argentea TaxID=1387174 RepID=UPI0030EE6188